MHKTQLLAGAQIQEIGEKSGSLRAGAFDKMVSKLRKEKILIISRIAPVGLNIRWTRGGCGRGWRWGRAGELLIKVSCRSAHARGWRSTRRTRLRHLDIMVGVESKLVVEDTAATLRETERPLITGHVDDSNFDVAVLSKG